jgi:hypothetical protein
MPIGPSPPTPRADGTRRLVRRSPPTTRAGRVAPAGRALASDDSKPDGSRRLVGRSPRTTRADGSRLPVGRLASDHSSGRRRASWSGLSLRTTRVERVAHGRSGCSPPARRADGTPQAGRALAFGASSGRDAAGQSDARLRRLERRVAQAGRALASAASSGRGRAGQSDKHSPPRTRPSGVPLEASVPRHRVPRLPDPSAAQRLQSRRRELGPIRLQSRNLREPPRQPARHASRPRRSGPPD